MWIGGKRVAALSGRTYYAVNPATEERIARLPRGGEADIKRALEAAWLAFPSWSKRPATGRARMASAIGRAIRDHAGELGGLEATHRGTPVRYSIPGFLESAEAFETAARVGPILMNTLLPSRRSTRYCFRLEPAGVCSFTPPWHAPFRLIAPALASALVAGNACVVECPASDSLAALRLVELIEALDIPPGVLNILTGTGRGAIGVPLPYADKGNAPAPGSRESSSGPQWSPQEKDIPCAAGLKHPPSLVVLGDADPDASVEEAMLDAFTDKGATWAEPGRYYIHESLYDLFVEKFAAAVERIVVGNPADALTEIGPALNAALRDRVERQISRALLRGATLLAAGRTHERRLPQKGYFLSPTILGGALRDGRGEGKAVFAPLVFLSRFSSIGQILDLTGRPGLDGDVRVCTADAAEKQRIALAMRIASPPSCQFLRASDEFDSCTRVDVVCRNYTTAFSQESPGSRN